MGYQDWRSSWEALRRAQEKAQQALQGRKADVPPWDAWCARFGIDPNTPDETILDAYLHGRTPGDGGPFMYRLPQALGWRSPAQAAWYAGWAAYVAAKQRMSLLERDDQSKAEIYELERIYRL